MPGARSWYDLDEARKIERRVGWKRDATFAATGQPVLVTREDLKHRGWTKGMVDTFLGSPDAIVALNSSGTRTLHLFRNQRAQEAEQTEEYQARARVAEARSQKSREAAQRRADEVRRAVESRAGHLRVRIPRGVKTLADLRQKALRSRDEFYMDRGDYSADPYEADQETVNRWTRNYLRHECSNYEEMLYQVSAEFRGVPGVQDMYHEVIRPIIDQRVEEAIRSLNPAS